MTHDFVNDVLDSGFFAVTELISTGSDALQLVFKELYKVAVFVSGHERDWPHESMTTLPCFGKGIREFWQAFVELLGRLMNGIRAGVEVNAVGNVPRQKKESDKICGFHIGNDTPRQRGQSIALHKGVASYIGGV